MKDIGKVVVLCGSYPPMPCGVGDSAHELALALIKKGLDIETVTDVQAEGITAENGPYPVHNVIEKWGFWSGKKIAKSIEDIKPDILHIHYPAKGYGKSLGVPHLPMTLKSRRDKFRIVVTLHEFKLSHSLRKRASFTLIEPSQAVVMPCPLELDALKKRHASVFKKIHEAIPVGPVGPSPEDYPPEEKKRLRERTRSNLGLDRDSVALLHYGTPTKSKGFDILFKGMEILMMQGINIRLLIAGDYDPEVNNFHRELKKRSEKTDVSSRISWLGRVPLDELPGIFLASDLGVFPFTDGYSFRRSSLNGVLAWNVPIITTEPDGKLPGTEHQDFVRFVKRNDAQALVDALLPLIVNPDRLNVLRNKKNPMKELFSWDNIADKYIELYRRVLEES